MKAMTALTVAGALFAVPAFAGGGSYEKTESTTTKSSQVPSTAQPQGSVIIEQQAASPADPRPQQGTDNPSGNLGNADLNREGSGGASTRLAPGASHPLEDKPDVLDTQELQPKSDMAR